MNYPFHINDWLPRFPLKEHKHGHFSGETITSPFDICQNEQLRQEMQDEFDWGEAVPVDIFIMADGEPMDRYVTKIGGLPYLPKRRWPINANGGCPMMFLAQFDFSDSEDLTGNLPGEVLLVFADPYNDYPREIYFEWQSLGLTDLIEPDEVPEIPPTANIEARRKRLDEQRELLRSRGIDVSTFPVEPAEAKTTFSPCHGHIFRTVSYPEARRRDKSRKYPSCRGKDVWSSHHLLQYQATQIGEAPFFIQRGDREGLPGKVLCTISSVQPECHGPYPWTNRPEPLLPQGKWLTHHTYFMLGDVGCIYISIDPDKKLHWNWSCY